MNPAYSDPQLLEWTLALSKKHKAKTFFETGTYHGHTSKIVSEYFTEVTTVENNPDHHTLAMETLRDVPNCTLHLGSSPDVMNQQLQQQQKGVVFFLDAHWNDYWPVLDELRIIKEKNITPVIIIHDFYVPNVDGSAMFGFDSYNGQPLNFDYIKTSIESIYGEKYQIKYSTTSTTDSGVIYIYPTK